MTRQEFARWCREKTRLLDGATGTNLMKAGMPRRVCPEAWILEHPETLLSLQEGYAQAGSEIVYAPTFGANRVRLESFGLAAELERINRELVGLTRRAVAGTAMVAGNLSSIGEPIEPYGDMTYEELVAVYREQAEILLASGVDLFAAETLMGMTEAMAAVEGIRSVSDLPILCTLTLQESGRGYFDGTGPEAAAALEKLGADAVGVNCSSGPEGMLPLVKSMAAVCALPLVAKPNAGLPQMRNGVTYYTMGPEEFADHLLKIPAVGAALVGGCCGTSPEFIQILRKRLDFSIGQPL